jgi:hypothetical protein
MQPTQAQEVIYDMASKHRPRDTVRNSQKPTSWDWEVEAPTTYDAYEESTVGSERTLDSKSSSSSKNNNNNARVFSMAIGDHMLMARGGDVEYTTCAFDVKEGAGDDARDDVASVTSKVIFFEQKLARSSQSSSTLHSHTRREAALPGPSSYASSSTLAARRIQEELGEEDPREEDPNAEYLDAEDF